MTPIYGIVAQDTFAATSPGPPGLDDPIAVADFINHIYLDHGSSVTIDDLIDVSTASIVTSGGLYLEKNAEAVLMIGAMRTALLTFDFTVLVDIDIPVAASQVLFHIGTYWAEPPFFYTNDVFCEFGYDIGDDNNDVGTGGGPGLGTGVPMERIAFDDNALFVSGLHKMAVTRTNDRVAISADGFPVSIDNSQGPFGMNPGTPQFTVLGGFAGSGTPTTGPSPISDTFYLRSIAIYPSQADALLPTLSG